MRYGVAHWVYISNVGTPRGTLVGQDSMHDFPQAMDNDSVDTLLHHADVVIGVEVPNVATVCLKAAKRYDIAQLFSREHDESDARLSNGLRLSDSVHRVGSGRFFCECIVFPAKKVEGRG